MPKWITTAKRILLVAALGTYLVAITGKLTLLGLLALSISDKMAATLFFGGMIAMGLVALAMRIVGRTADRWYYQTRHPPEVPRGLMLVR